MTTRIAYLVVRPDMSLRISARPRIAPNEVRVKLTLKFPDSWGREVGAITIDMPDCPPEVSFEPVEEPLSATRETAG